MYRDKTIILMNIPCNKIKEVCKELNVELNDYIEGDELYEIECFEKGSTRCLRQSRIICHLINDRKGYIVYYYNNNELDKHKKRII